MIHLVAAIAGAPDNTLVIVALITSLGSVIVAIAGGVFAIVRGRTKTPADDNEASRIAREWYRGMLEDAKEERAELQGTIDTLRADGTEKSTAITNLEAIVKKKDARIAELEARQQRNVEKLQAGHVLTLADVLGQDPSTLPPLAVDMEHTVLKAS